jgi:hypothetical protein
MTDVDVLRDTLDAIHILDMRLVDCDGRLSRRIVSRAIEHLEASLLAHVTGPHTKWKVTNWNVIEGGEL